MSRVDWKVVQFIAFGTASKENERRGRTVFFGLGMMSSLGLWPLIKSSSTAENVSRIAYVHAPIALTPSLVSDTAFPREETLDVLLHVVRQQPKLAKDASSALIDIGQAIHDSVSRQELEVLIRGTLLQEVYVRNSCLQALQVTACPSFTR